MKQHHVKKTREEKQKHKKNHTKLNAEHWERPKIDYTSDFDC